MQAIDLRTLVSMIQNFMEKQIGIKNLSYVDIRPDSIEFGIRAMRFLIVIGGMKCYRISSTDSKTIYNDHSSIMIENRLREYLGEELGETI